MKDKIQTIVGLLIVAFLVIGAAKSIFFRNFKSPEIKVLKSSKINSPIKNVLFWREEELEKTSSSTVGAKLSSERQSFIEPLYDNLKKLEW